LVRRLFLFSLLRVGISNGSLVDRSRSHRCWCGVGLFHEFLNGHATCSQKSVSAILNSIHVRQSSTPQTPLHEIYYSLAEERTNKSKWLIEFSYLYLLRDAGCFDPRTAPPPEQFAELMTNVEEKIRLQASGVAGKD
jgi:hypothetical protein